MSEGMSEADFKKLKTRAELWGQKETLRLCHEIERLRAEANRAEQWRERCRRAERRCARYEGAISSARKLLVARDILSRALEADDETNP